MASRTQGAIEYLLKDHSVIRGLFSQYLKSASMRQSFEVKKKIAEQIVRETVMHDTAETSALYPIVRVMLDNGSKTAGQMLSEHQRLKEVLYNLENAQSTGEAAKMDQLVSDAKETFESHAEGEEQVLFPRLQKAMTENQLEALKTALQAAKAIGPTHPHPWSPNKPFTGGAVAGPVVGVYDRVKDFVTGKS